MLTSGKYSLYGKSGKSGNRMSMSAIMASSTSRRRLLALQLPILLMTKPTDSPTAGLIDSSSESRIEALDSTESADSPQQELEKNVVYLDSTDSFYAQQSLRIGAAIDAYLSMSGSLDLLMPPLNCEDAHLKLLLMAFDSAVSRIQNPAARMAFGRRFAVMNAQCEDRFA